MLGAVEIFYSVVTGVYVLGLMRLQPRKPALVLHELAANGNSANPLTVGNKPTLHVIIPLRNERAGLDDRMARWLELAQRWPEAQFFAVDNQSTDGTLERLEQRLKNSRIRVLSTDRPGKIECWRAVFGQNHHAPPSPSSLHDFYLLMDADVTIQNSSVEAVLQAMMVQDADISPLPLAVGASSGRWWFDFQSMEFTSLYGTGQRLLEQGKATLFSSALVMVRGDLFRDFLAWYGTLQLDDREGRGPDALWSRFLGQRGQRGFRALRGDVQMLGTMPEHESVGDWLRQRSRWASHALTASGWAIDGFQLAVIAVVLAANSMVIALWFHPGLVALWSIKMLAEWRYFSTFSAPIVRKRGLGRYLSYAFAYPGLMGMAAFQSLLMLRRRDHFWR